MTTNVQIGNRQIGDGHPCFIIAEAGSNHNGSLTQAKQLIDVAASAGADAVKFQLFRSNRLYTNNAGTSDYLSIAKPIHDLVAELEMPYEWLPELATYSRERRLVFLASAFDEESSDQLDMHVDAFKIASYEMTHIPLVRHVAAKMKPVIVSTGTSDMEEVENTVKVFLNTGNKDLILMQCTAAYPAPVDSLNIRAIVTMKSKFRVPVGLSDHSRDPILAPLTAVAVGANLVEKHFTLSNDLPGPDHRFAVEPHELRLMIQKVREVEKALGEGAKVMQPVEAELRGFARRSIFAIQDIKQGEKFSKENLAVLRSGKSKPGLEPAYLDEILGKHATQDIPAWRAIQKKDYR